MRLFDLYGQVGPEADVGQQAARNRQAVKPNDNSGAKQPELKSGDLDESIIGKKSQGEGHNFNEMTQTERTQENAMAHAKIEEVKIERRRVSQLTEEHLKPIDQANQLQRAGNVDQNGNRRNRNGFEDLKAKTFQNHRDSKESGPIPKSIYDRQGSGEGAEKSMQSEGEQPNQQPGVSPPRALNPRSIANRSPFRSSDLLQMQNFSPESQHEKLADGSETPQKSPHLSPKTLKVQPDSKRKNYYRRSGGKHSIKSSQQQLKSSIRHSVGTLISVANSGQTNNKSDVEDEEQAEQDDGVDDDDQESYDQEQEQKSTREPQVQVFRGDASSQELIIENLENLDDTAALIVTRDGDQFKIAVKQDTNTSVSASMAEKADTVSNYQSTTNRHLVSSQHGSLIHKIKMSGATRQHQIGILPPSVSSKFRHIQNSRSSKQSGQSRITVSHINNSMMMDQQQQVYSIQKQSLHHDVSVADSVFHLRSSNTMDSQESSTRGKFHPKQHHIVARPAHHNNSISAVYQRHQQHQPERRCSASDNKRDAITVSPRPYENRPIGDQQLQLLEYRSQIERAQAEEQIRQSREQKQPISVKHQHQQSAVTISPLQLPSLVFGSQTHKKRLSMDPRDRSDTKLGPTVYSSNMENSMTASAKIRSLSSVHQKQKHAILARRLQQFKQIEAEQHQREPLSGFVQPVTSTGAASGAFRMNDSLTVSLESGNTASLSIAKKDTSAMRGGPRAQILIEEHRHEENPLTMPSANETIGDHLAMQHDQNAVQLMQELYERQRVAMVNEESQETEEARSRRSNTDMKGSDLVKITNAEQIVQASRGFAAVKEEESAGHDDADTQHQLANFSSSHGPQRHQRGQLSDRGTEQLEHRTVQNENNSAQLLNSPPKTSNTSIKKKNAVPAAAESGRSSKITGKKSRSPPKKPNNALLPAQIHMSQSELSQSNGVRTSVDGEGQHEAVEDNQVRKQKTSRSKAKSNSRSPSGKAETLAGSSKQPSQGPSRMTSQAQQPQHQSSQRRSKLVKNYNKKMQQQAAPSKADPEPKGAKKTPKKSPNNKVNRLVESTSVENEEGERGQAADGAVSGSNADTDCEVAGDKGGLEDTADHESGEQEAESANGSQLGEGEESQPDESNEEDVDNQVERSEVQEGDESQTEEVDQQNQFDTVSEQDERSLGSQAQPKKSAKKLKKSQVPTLDLEKAGLTSNEVSKRPSPMRSRKSKASAVAGEPAEAKAGAAKSPGQKSKVSLKSRASVKSNTTGKAKKAPSVAHQNTLQTAEENLPQPSRNSRQYQQVQQDSSSRILPSLGRQSELTQADKPQGLAASGAALNTQPSPLPEVNKTKVPNQAQPAVNWPFKGHNPDPKDIKMYNRSPIAAKPDQVGRVSPNATIDFNTKKPDAKKGADLKQQEEELKKSAKKASERKANGEVEDGADASGAREEEGKEKPDTKHYPLKYFKGQDLELYYSEKQLKPGVEQEIKKGFFEIRNKFAPQSGADQNESGPSAVDGGEVQVYVSHLCLHNFHPIFSKFNLDVVKTILNLSQIVYLKPNEVLYEPGYNDRYLYVVLFGKLRLSLFENDQPIGMVLNLGWTAGEEILFRSDMAKRKQASGAAPGSRSERCRSLDESCVLGIEKRNLAQIKRTLVERGQSEEFVKLEVVLRGNYLVKKAWR